MTLRYHSKELVKKQKKAINTKDKTFTYGTVTSIFVGSGVVPSTLVADIATVSISGIPYAKGVGITVGDTVLLLNLGGLWFAVCSVQT